MGRPLQQRKSSLIIGEKIAKLTVQAQVEVVFYSACCMLYAWAVYVVPAWTCMNKKSQALSGDANAHANTQRGFRARRASRRRTNPISADTHSTYDVLETKCRSGCVMGCCLEDKCLRDLILRAPQQSELHWIKQVEADVFAEHAHHRKLLVSPGLTPQRVYSSVRGVNTNLGHSIGVRRRNHHPNTTAVLALLSYIRIAYRHSKELAARPLHSFKPLPLQATTRPPGRTAPSSMQCPSA